MRKKLTILLALAALLVAACGEDDVVEEPTPTQAETTTTAAGTPEPDDSMDDDAMDDEPDDVAMDDMSMPGEGVSVEMARANWSTGYFQAEVYRALLQELGYEVSDPSQAELGPDIFYVGLAGGDFDFWVNSWFPLHEAFLSGELADGSLVSDHVSVVGAEMMAGGLQGFMVDMTTAEANGIVTLADIGDNPDVAALFDTDGNGKADLFGCNDGWGCQIVINDTISQNGWDDTIEQISGDYSALWLDVVARYERGDPILTYTWTPSAYITQLVPGQDVIWLSVPNPVQPGAAALPADQCPGQPCTMGFTAADILVTANNDFLTANPAAAELLAQVQIGVIDVALQNVRMDAGENSQADIVRHAHEWIEANRDTANGWLANARSATEFVVTMDDEAMDDMSMPGEGVSVEMARANWSTGYFQAEVYRALLQELGYEVSDPSQAELGPDIFYVGLAGGDFDFWVNSWFPLHEAFLSGELADGSLVSDHVSVVGAEMMAGGLQGFMVDMTTAEANGIVTLADIGDNPDVAALFDTDGNGKADLFGCNDGWGCQIVINDTISQNGWDDTIEQISGDYSALWLDVVARYERGDPILTYTWTPSAYITQLVPGQDVIWLSVPNPVQPGAAALPADQCPGQPCTMGFTAADILVTANNDFLTANPAAAELLAQVQIGVIDVALQNVRMDAGENSQADIVRHAHEWIEANRDTANGWLQAARIAG